jgi:hypothetical protein
MIHYPPGLIVEWVTLAKVLHEVKDANAMIDALQTPQ